jgi:hypothetical protein
VVEVAGLDGESDVLNRFIPSSFVGVVGTAAMDADRFPTEAPSFIEFKS